MKTIFQGGSCKSSEAEKSCDSSEEDTSNEIGSGVIDVEDLGSQLLSAKNSTKEVQNMVTEQLRQTLTKQGYKIIGSHSGVKMCRWTKVKIMKNLVKKMVFNLNLIKLHISVNVKRQRWMLQAYFLWY